MQTVIALTDNNKIFSELFYYSTLYGYRFAITGSAEEALALFAQYRPAMLVADCSDKEQHFLKFARQLSPGLAVIAICDGGADEDVVVEAYKNGADSVLRLQCGSREFYYRLTNLIRLLNLGTGQDKVQVITLGGLKIYPQNNQVMLGGEFIPLTGTEFKLLLLFVQRINRLVTLDELHRLMYETEELQYTSRALSVHISKLRHKLKLADIPELELKNIHGKGYRLIYTGSSRNGENYE